VIETALNFGIGFLSAVLLGLLLVPLLLKRAVSQAVHRALAAAPYSTEEIRADKEQLRAKLAVSTRQLETSVAAMKAKTMSKIAELGYKTDFINQLRHEIGEKEATIFALAGRNKSLHERLTAAEEEFEIRSSALREAEEVIADKEAELVRLVTELGEHSTIANVQRAEIDALRTQVEDIKTSIADYENTLEETVLRLRRDDAEADTPWTDLAEANDEFASLGGHRNRRT
jgi:chromosome segregation ATPase